MPVLGKIATRTKPVAKVAVIAPRVPTADSRPTTDPVRRRSDNWSLTTIGVIDDNSAEAGSRISPASSTTPPAADPRRYSPDHRATGGIRAVAAAPSSSAGAISRLGATRSANHPPIHAP